MEAVVNGSVAAKRPSARSTTLDADAARDLLNYFEIDENEKEFLISAISSSKAHEGEVKALLHDRAFSSHTSEDDTSEDDDNQNDNAPTGRHSIPWRTPENPEAPPMDANTARNLLCGFNIDDDLREFLMAIIMSGKVFEDDLRQLYKIGLSAGWETFQAQVQCAKSLRDKVLARHYGDDLTLYLGMLRESDHIMDFKERYWPLGAPALNASDKLVAGKHLWGGLVDGNTTSLQSIQLVHDDDSQVNNNIVPMDKPPPPDWSASNPQPTKTASDTTKKTKTKTQSTEQASSAANDARFEVVCPIRRPDGSICNKRCYDGKAYRSMQEHIRKVHKDHYIPGLNANEESFRRMVNNTPGAESNLQQVTNGAKGPEDQVGDLNAQLVRPADLSLPLANGAANGATVDSGKQQRVAKKAKQSHEKTAAKSPFFVDQGQNLMDVNVTGPMSGMMQAQSALGGAFDETQFLSPFGRGQDGFGAMSLGLDATISQSLFPQHVDGVAQSSVSPDRKRKRDDANSEPQDQSSSLDLQVGLNGSAGELYNPPVDPNLFFQTLPPQPAPPVAPDVFDEMIDILGQLQEASREMSGPTTGHYNPPAEITASQTLSAKRNNPFAAPTPPAKAKPAQKQAASHFFVSPSKKIDEARTAAVTPSPTAKKTSRPARGTVSALPIPPLAGDRFGLVQEELAADPFRLLVAVTFLIRTPGKVAIPVFRQLMERYPTPQALAEADPADIEAMMHRLGLSNQRTKTIQKYARTWLERPPSKDVRYGIKDYPQKGDGKDVRAGEVFGPEDHTSADKVDGVVGIPGSPDSAKENDPQAKTTARGHGTAWEIGHLTTGRYAVDSWRIFCRDVLLGRAQDWKGKGRDGSFQPEWMRVLPEDKELRACLRWMWMREGWEWDPKTGEKTPLREEMRRAVDEGRVAYDNQGQLQILEKVDGQVDGNGVA